MAFISTLFGQQNIEEAEPYRNQRIQTTTKSDPAAIKGNATAVTTRNKWPVELPSAAEREAKNLTEWTPTSRPSRALALRRGYDAM